MAIDKIKVTELKKLAKKGDVKAMVELAKTYDPKDIEDRLYRKWEEKSFKIYRNIRKTVYRVQVPSPQPKQGIYAEIQCINALFFTYLN